MHLCPPPSPPHLPLSLFLPLLMLHMSTTSLLVRHPIPLPKLACPCWQE